MVAYLPSTYKVSDFYAVYRWYLILTQKLTCTTDGCVYKASVTRVLIKNNKKQFITAYAWSHRPLVILGFYHEKCVHLKKAKCNNNLCEHFLCWTLSFSASLPPKLIVNPMVITDTDTVTLKCETPPSVSIAQCHFYTSSGTIKNFSCMKRLTGTELLDWAMLRSPAEVKIGCQYIIKPRKTMSPSSNMSCVKVQSESLSFPHHYM